jgi:hypothetical protein
LGRRASQVCSLQSAAHRIGASTPRRSARRRRSPMVWSPSVRRPFSIPCNIDGAWSEPRRPTFRESGFDDSRTEEALGHG